MKMYMYQTTLNGCWISLRIYKRIIISGYMQIKSIN